MNGRSIMSLITTKNVKLVDKFRERIEGSHTMMALIHKLDGATATEAYDVINKLSLKEKKVLATLIGEINAELKK